MTVLPQNTQNGLRPTQNTQKIFGKHGVRTSVYSVCRRNAPQKTKFSEGTLRSNGEAARKGPRGFSVFSGQDCWHGGRNTTEHTERAYARHRTHRRGWGGDDMNWSNDITMYFDLGTRIEVDEKPEPDICCFQIIEQLGSVSGMQSFDGLEFEDNLIEANDVGHIETTVPPFIEDVKRWLGDKGNVPLFQFLFERVLIDLFKVARTECRVDFVYCTSDGKCLFLENVVAHGSNYSKCSEPSVCSVAETVRLAVFTTEHTEDFRKARVRTSVYSVCRRRRLQCVQW